MNSAKIVPFEAACPEPEEKPLYELRSRKRPGMAHQKLVVTSFMGDLLAIILALCVGYLIRFETVLGSIGVEDLSLTLKSYVGHLVFGTVVMMALAINYRLYDPKRFLTFRPMVKAIFQVCVSWSVLFLSLALVLKIDPAISRIYCVVAGNAAMVALLGWRYVFHTVIRSCAWGKALRQKVVFLGWNEECEAAVSRMTGGSTELIQVAGVIRPQDGKFESEPPFNVPVLGEFADLRQAIRAEDADMLIAVNGAADRVTLMEVSEICGREFIDFKLVPSCFQVLVSSLKLETVNGMPLLGVGQLPLHHALNSIIKRAFDIVGALAGLAIFGPVIGLFMAMVRAESKGPLIYKQVRLGLDGKPFEILKIRSMKIDAEASGSPGWTVKDDPRCLKVGAFMRRWNIDELPQFWNVLRGDMSLVGPRPERPELIQDFKEEIPHYNLRHNIKPGLTGWAQINGLRGDTCLKTRIKFDLHYMENWNFLWDLRIMALTFFKRSGAC
ncbi:sugar transferase [Roseibacillus persicicus]|uniref:Undecaprenyl-phosphate glucose phosphotransferase n=1 Tax=Roseibacillus persicicus TaxID=454148 RepID=A0A918TQ21_9BACT|nr:sugar transferase [Roseibacillus persicicus]MDQ8191059.1 sugar transferase [Roseibacillus persicicus]GHC56708.1 undecaprenyl-phosphate glucose phosphotransferase [Roseibacillus persicicus]